MSTTTLERPAPAPATATAPATAPATVSAHRVRITEGRWSRDQFECWERNCHKPAYKRDFIQPDDAQLFYLCQAKENGNLEAALQSLTALGISDDRVEAVKTKLACEEQDGQVTRPSFAGVDLVSNSSHKELLEAAIKSSPGCLRGADLEEARLNGADMRQADLRGTILARADMREVNLEEARLNGAVGVGADLGGANLRDTILARADLRKVNLEKARLNGAVLQMADLRGAGLWGVQTDKETNWVRANLRGAANLPWISDANRFGYLFTKGLDACTRSQVYRGNTVLKGISDVLEVGNRVLQAFGLNR